MPGSFASSRFAEEALEAIGVVVWRNIDFEADDAIATAAIRWVEDVDQVVIATPDKDMCQLVIGDRIVTYNRREQKIVRRGRGGREVRGPSRVDPRLPGPGG